MPLVDQYIAYTPPLLAAKAAPRPLLDADSLIPQPTLPVTCTRGVSRARKMVKKKYDQVQEGAGTEVRERWK
jgi:hypothetical protein